MLVKTEELLDSLALAGTVGYAPDLADFAHAAQTHVFADLEPPED